MQHVPLLNSVGSISYIVIVAGLDTVASVISFILYFVDKNAARNCRQRIPESTLHLFALVGGWPGALIAQQVFRHKTRKTSFRIVFWLTVLLNVGGTLWLCSPTLTKALRSLL